MYWSGCQSTGAEMRKYFTARGPVSGRWRRAGERPLLTVVNLLQSDLSIVWQGLLGFCAQHERLGLLRRNASMLRVHGEWTAAATALDVSARRGLDRANGRGASRPGRTTGRRRERRAQESEAERHK